MIKITYIMLFFMLFGCGSNNNEEQTIKDISVNKTLVAKTIKISTNMLMPTRIFNTNNKLVIYDQVKNGMFKVFNLPEMEYQYSFGQIGKGPDEFSFIDANTMKMMNDNLLFLDFHTIKKLKIYNKEIKVSNSNSIRIENSPVNGLNMINDSLYIYNLMGIKKNGYEHQMVNINSKKTIKEFGTYPDTNIKYTNEFEQFNAYYKYSVSNPINNKLAIFYLYLNKMKIYSNKGELLQEINIEDNYREYSPKDKDKNILFRGSCISTSNFIYVLRIDQPKNEIEKNFDSFKPKIEIWNWEGKLLKKYQLDKPITSFTVSEKDNKLFGISISNSNEIYEYKLPKSSNITSIRKSNFKQIHNDFYTINIPKGWSYSTPEKEKNKLTKFNNLLYNTSIFFNPEEKEKFGSSFWVCLISNSEKKDISIDAFLKSHDLSNEDEYKFKIEKFKDKSIFVKNFKRENSLPNGKKFTSYITYWHWKEGKNIIEIQYTSCVKDEKILNTILKCVHSFTLK
ncbi:BF3164 family lipoprotein [Flavobacterium sp. MAHUQ-51]|uniref:BF3164 family lipoprotein n=1 Tax=Flavobacterium sp. GCM10022190 TaxID=3252639 RepID=UPI00361D0E91